jgi:hypothetical protein
MEGLVVDACCLPRPVEHMFSGILSKHSLPHCCACLQEIGELRQALSREVDELRSEFGDLKAALKQQIEVMNSVQAATAAATGGSNSLAATH